VRFIADMCMDVRVASWLNSQGHDATHLRDEGLQRLPNGGVFEKAIAESGDLHRVGPAQPIDLAIEDCINSAVYCPWKSG